MKIIIISIFGVAGVLSRYLVGIFSTKYFESQTLGTFLVNIIGGLIVGCAYSLLNEKDILSPDLQSGIFIGFLGGFTTFSAYYLDIIKLIENNSLKEALLLFILCPVLGLLAAAGSLLLTKSLLSVR